MAPVRWLLVGVARKSPPGVAHCTLLKVLQDRRGVKWRVSGKNNAQRSGKDEL